VKVAAALYSMTPSHSAAVSGSYASWDPPLSYSTVTLLNTNLGVYNPQTGTCLRDADIISAVFCPAGYYKRPSDEIADRCPTLGMLCPADYICLCSPCKLADEIEVFTSRNNALVWRNGESNRLCSKMETCTSVQQNQPLNILVVQNSGESFKSNISFKLSTAARLHGYAEYRDHDNSFLIEIKSAEKGTHILQVFLNKTEIPNSPFLIEILSRNCSAGTYFQADDNGDCICKSSSLLSLLYCEVQYLVIFCLAILVFSGATGYICYLNGNRLSREDKLHYVKATELRAKLGITMRGRVILSTERVPIWLKPKSFIVLQAENFDAAVRLNSFRDDFDIKQVDGFCIALRGSSCYGNICDWILQICRCLLNPADNVKEESSQNFSPRRIQNQSNWQKNLQQQDC